jgi:hypothetical protein
VAFDGDGKLGEVAVAGDLAEVPLGDAHAGSACACRRRAGA